VINERHWLKTCIKSCERERAAARPFGKDDAG